MSNTDTIRVMVGLAADDEKHPRTEDYDVEQLKAGFSVGVKLAQEFQCPLWIITPTKRDLENPSIEQALGHERVQTLIAKGVQYLSSHQVTIRFGTPATSGFNPRGVLLLLYPNASVFASLDLRTQTQAEIVVPWLLQDVQPWIDVWGARQLLGNKVHDLPMRDVSDPDIAEAIDNALRMSGLGHPSDEKRARTLFSNLRRKKKEIDPAAVRAYALRTTGHGIRTADKLAKIAIGRQSSS